MKWSALLARFMSRDEVTVPRPPRTRPKPGVFYNPDTERIELTWTCMICGKRRPGSEITVESATAVFDSGANFAINVRCCADSEECRAGAREQAATTATQWERL